jgi:hypothetical protein
MKSYEIFSDTVSERVSAITNSFFYEEKFDLADTSDFLPVIILTIRTSIGEDQTCCITEHLTLAFIACIRSAYLSREEARKAQLQSSNAGFVHLEEVI